MRNTLKYMGVGIVSYIVLSQSANFAIKMYKYYNPDPPPEPSAGFGPLPMIEFKEVGGYDLMFDLETPNGRLPNLGDRSIVYYMPFQRTSLLALDEAKDTAERLGFDNEPVAITSEIYQWKMSIPSPVVLEQNIADGSYNFNYQWQTDKNLITNKNIPGKEQTIRSVEQFFDRFDVSLDDVTYEDVVITYTKASGNKMIPAVSISDADFVQVDVFRNEIKNKQGEKTELREVVTADPARGIIRMFFSGSNTSSKKVVSVESNYYPVNYNEPHTYYLKPIEQAWEELKSGSGYVALNEDDEANTIYIRRVTLGYYDTYKAQEFIQPVYIFRGDNGGSDEFVAYIHAINDAHIKSEK